jgi:hypothetical protein
VDKGDLTGTRWKRKGMQPPTILVVDGDHAPMDGGWLFHYEMVRGNSTTNGKQFRIPTHRLREAFTRL